MLIASALTALIGFLASGYMVLVKQRMESDKEYKPICDINELVSCSAPLKSKYGNLFGPTNALVGVMFYSVVFFLALFGYSTLVLLAAIAAAAISCYLAYILYFKIRVLCPLCTVIYAVNALLLLTALSSW